MTASNLFYFEFYEVLIRFTINTLVIILISIISYRKDVVNKQYASSFILMGITIFLTCSYLGMVKVELGLVLGLFAIFSILRFRTKNIAFSEMVNLFVVISISAVNSLASFPNVYRGLFLCNAIIVVAMFVLKTYGKKVTLHKREMTIAEIYLLRPSQKTELIKYLKEVTELNIKHINISSINNIKGEAKIIIHYSEE